MLRKLFMNDVILMMMKQQVWSPQCCQSREGSEGESRDSDPSQRQLWEWGRWKGWLDWIMLWLSTFCGWPSEMHYVTCEWSLRAWRSNRGFRKSLSTSAFVFSPIWSHDRLRIWLLCGLWMPGIQNPLVLSMSDAESTSNHYYALSWCLKSIVLCVQFLVLMLLVHQECLYSWEQ